ncbi:maltose ABC transporter permease MalG, partial [Vibrio cholerae]
SMASLAGVFFRSVDTVTSDGPLDSLPIYYVISYTLAVGMRQSFYAQNYLRGDFAAADVLSAFTITIVFQLAQRLLVGGLTAGGVKG